MILEHTFPWQMVMDSFFPSPNDLKVHISTCVVFPYKPMFITSMLCSQNPKQTFKLECYEKVYYESHNEVTYKNQRQELQP